MANRTVPLDLDKLEEVCAARFTDLGKLGELRRNKKNGGRHIFIDRGSSILGVAHLDTVATEFHFFTGQIDRKLYIFNSQLDDRLGAYLLLHPLTQMLGHKAFDILFTEDEETANSTAIDFVTSKTYNWIFSFDRMGTDVVMYQYDNARSERILKQHGLTLRTGSYSCIADLEHLGVCGYNFGCGYHDNHTELAHAIWPETATMVGRFAKFYWAERNESHPYEARLSRGCSRHTKWSNDYKSNYTPSTEANRPITEAPKLLTPPPAPISGIVLPHGLQGVPTNDASEAEWNQWLAGEQERIAQRAERERQYAERHPEYQSDRNYTCVICNTPKFAEEIQLSTMTCYLCISTYHA